MTLTATYMGDLSRVRVSFTSAPTYADYALIERSTDGVNWATVRGGSTVPINSGAGKIDDYEFESGKLNTYRASYVDSAVIFGLGQGTAVSGVNVSLTPPFAGAEAPGDLLLCFASISNSGVGTVNTPTGYTPLVVSGNMALFGRRFVAGDTAPTVTFSGGAAGVDTIAQMCKIVNAELVPLTSAAQLNASAQNIAVPGITINATNTLYLALGWKASTITSATGGTTTQIGLKSGAVSALTWFYQSFPTAGPGAIAAGTITATGGAAAISRGAALALRKADYVTQDTASLTPTPTSVWLKNPSRPSLNTPLTVTDWSDITRPARTGVIDVIGRTMPVAVTDVQGSRRMTLTITTTNLADAADMDKRLATGEPVFLQAPNASCPIPTMYAVIGVTAQSRNSKRTTRRYFDLPLIEVAAPASVVAGDTILYADLPTTWATYADVLSSKATYSDLIDSISTAVVIVP